MRFWDSSAIIPLLVSEATTPAVTTEYGRDPEMLVWWAAPVECTSALTRREREGDLEPAALSGALARLSETEAGWSEVLPVDRVRVQAVRLLRVHALRAADALQLGAAITASEGQPATLPLVTLDDALALAAEREGFPVVRPGSRG